MAKEQKRKPVFHEADPTPKEEFRPHHIGAIEENEGIGAELQLPEQEIEEHGEEIVEDGSVDGITPVPEPAGEEAGSEDVLSFGWRVIGSEQQTGKTYIVASQLEEEGVRAFWRRTRVLSHNKWTTRGKWSDTLTRADILPDPRFYKKV